MGIRYLTQWIQWISPLHTMESTKWEVLRGKRIGIDALSILYRAKAERMDVLEMLASLIRSLRAWDIDPLFVFDGKSPREKDGTRSARRRQRAQLPESEQIRVSSDTRNEVKQLFYALGVLSLTAEQEADTVLAYLAKANHIAAVISADMDFLPRGVETLLIPYTLSDLTTWRCASLSHLLSKAHMTVTQFVEMCVLMGCDYAPVIPTISYQSAYWRIKGGKSMLEILAGEGIRTFTAWETAAVILRGEKDQLDTILSEYQREKWAAGPPPPEPYAAILHVLPKTYQFEI